MKADNQLHTPTEVIFVTYDFFTVYVMYRDKNLRTMCLCSRCLLDTFKHATVHAYRPAQYNEPQSECDICHVITTQKALYLFSITPSEFQDAVTTHEILYSPIRDQNYEIIIRDPTKLSDESEGQS